MIKLTSLPGSKIPTLSAKYLIKNLFDLMAFKYQTIGTQYLIVSQDRGLKEN